ncbi:tetratricopeptide repeat protein [Pseudofulvimonas gallinarii]|nr:tetratricopeptide repeat protein [Pseudofulvimonas gallinarii]
MNGTLERFAATRAAPTLDVTDMLEEILKIHQSGQLDEAEQRYREWLAANPADPEALHRLAVLRRQRGDLREALELAGKAAETAPDQARYQVTLAGLHLDEPDYDAALKHYESALRINPNMLAAALGLVQAGLARGDLAAARSAMARAERIDPEHPQLRYQKAKLAQALGNHQLAVKLFLDLAKLTPNEPALHANAAKSFIALGQIGIAEQALRNALGLNPDYVDARISMGQLMMREGRPAEAWQEFERAMKVHPGHPLALVGRGDLRGLRGDLAGAVEDYRQAHTTAPDVPEIVAALVLGLGAAGDADQAREVLLAALQRQPASTELRRLQLSMLRNDGEASLAACREWSAVDPDNLEPTQHLASLLELRGDFEGAESLANEVLQRDSRAAFSRLLMVRSALRRNNPTEAQEQINRLPETGLEPALRIERNRLRGFTRDQLDDHAGAVDAWSVCHQLQRGLVKPVTPPGVAGIPAAVGTTDDPSEPTFLLGTPGMGVEGLASLLAQAGVRIMSDRFGSRPRKDAISTGQFVELAAKAASDQAAVTAFRDSYLSGLGGIGLAPEPTLVDNLPFPDLRYLGLIAAAFPKARYLVIERDPRDALLAWLSHGIAQGVAMPAEQAAAGAWLAALDTHLKAALARVPADRVLRIHARELDEPKALVQRIAGFLDNASLAIADQVDVRHTRGGLPTFLPDGRWQAYRNVLAEAFAPLS